MIESYKQAAQLANPQHGLSTLVGGGGESKTGNPAFKGELSNVLGALYQGIKNQGHTAETHVTQQIMGVGNVEQTAVSLSELNANLEVAAQGLRIAVEKINELTTRTMGG